jgi:BirA family biotin operon repressor/biotin-[acetyl-CoA-carboxylase] ligase
MTPREQWHLDTRHLGRRVLVYDQVDSTNTRAAALAHDNANDGLVILAGEQTAGRGQHGRSWQCPGGAGVLLSALLFPTPALRRPALLTAWAAVSVCETILQVTGLQAKIKWPNDVLIQGKKVCGILIEQARGTVAGIGLNVNQPAEVFAAAGLTEAASLAIFTGQRFECREVARRLIQQLDEQYAQLCDGEVATLEACWKWRIGLLGKQVAAECPNGVHQGRLRELSFAGLELEQADGQVMVLQPEAVRHLEPI